MTSFIVGKYVYDKHENLPNFFKSLKVPEHLVDKLIPTAGTPKNFSVDGNKIIMSGAKSVVTYELNTEVEETNEHNYSFKSTAKIDGNKLIVNSKAVKDDKTLIRTYECNEKGLMITLKSDETDVEAKIFYKKQ